jgi:hypothetical protein
MLLSSRILRHTRLFSTPGTRLWSISLQRIARIALGVDRGATWDRRWFHLISGDRRRSDRGAQRLGATSHKSVRCDSRRRGTRDKSTRAYCSPCLDPTRLQTGVGQCLAEARQNAWQPHDYSVITHNAHPGPIVQGLPFSLSARLSAIASPLRRGAIYILISSLPRCDPHFSIYSFLVTVLPSPAHPLLLLLLLLRQALFVEHAIRH